MFIDHLMGKPAGKLACVSAVGGFIMVAYGRRSIKNIQKIALRDVIVYTKANDLFVKNSSYFAKLTKHAAGIPLDEEIIFVDVGDNDVSISRVSDIKVQNIRRSVLIMNIEKYIRVRMGCGR